jgi:hypothetical protein|tara:strand:+ start:3757 stop:3948 length:192 start_codon:yes stop_codon:yes gene_type:complete
MNIDDMPQDAWVTWSKVKELEARITALECHKNICDHPRVEEDWVFDGEDEIHVNICMVCGDTV